MNVLYLTYDGLTDGLGRSQVLPYIFGLSKKGHHFTVISFEKPGRFPEGKKAIEDLCTAHSVDWIPLTYTASPPVISTIYDILRLRRCVRNLHWKKNFDIIHCRSYITSLVGLHMKRKFGVRFLFDMRAFYADERVDGGLWNLQNPVFRAVYNFFKHKEVEFLSEADHSISLTTKGKHIIHSWKNIERQPVAVEVIPCCADLDHFNPSQIQVQLQSELRSKLNLCSDDFVITYLGSVGTWYMLDEMLDFFKVLLEKRPDSKFLFITPDEPKSILYAAEKRGIPTHRFAIDKADREEVPTYLSLANAAIFFIKPVFSKSGSSPTKHGEMLGMGLPVIANAGVGDVDSIIEETNSGILIREFTTDAYEKAVVQLDKLMEIPVSALQAAAQKYYSLEEGVDRYDRVYHLMCANGGTSHSEGL